MSVAEEAVWRPADQVVSRVIEGHVVLVSVARNEATFLNPVGTALWSRLGGAADAAQLTDALAQAYKMPTGEAGAAVAAWIADLAALGLVERGASEDAAPVEPVPFPDSYDVPAVAPMETLQVMGGCTSSDAFCSISASV